MSTVIHLPFPPSVNSYWRAVNGRTILSERGREYRKDAVMLAKEFRGRYCDKQQYLQVDVHYIPPDRRVRDIDNYLKCVFDALTHAGVWKDDSQVKRLYVDWSIYPDPHKAGSVCLRIEDLQ